MCFICSTNNFLLLTYNKIDQVFFFFPSEFENLTFYKIWIHFFLYYKDDFSVKQTGMVNKFLGLDSI